MVEEKSWYMSTTIWGALIAVAASFSSAIGLPLDAGLQQEMAEAAVKLVGALGGIIAIYGRLVATDVIS